MSQLLGAKLPRPLYKYIFSFCSPGAGFPPFSSVAASILLWTSSLVTWSLYKNVQYPWVEPAFFSLNLQLMSLFHRHTEFIEITMQCFGFTYDLRDCWLPIFKSCCDLCHPWENFWFWAAIWNNCSKIFEVCSSFYYTFTWSLSGSQRRWTGYNGL